MNIRRALQAGMALVVLVLGLACASEVAVAQQTNKPNPDRVRTAFSPKDFRNLPQAAPDYLNRLHGLDPAKRDELFKQLAKGDTTMLASEFGTSGILFFEATRYIEGHYQTNPSFKRLHTLYDHWVTSTGDLKEFLAKWNTPVIDGFKMSYVQDLAVEKAGTRLLGHRIRNSGTVAWPATLELEPLMDMPRRSVDINTLPKAVKVVHPNGSPVKPGETIDVYFDVTDIKAKSGAKLYLISTFQDENGHRRYVLPQPLTALGKAPNTLYFEF